jgi:hypothetical protein
LNAPDVSYKGATSWSISQESIHKVEFGWAISRHPRVSVRRNPCETISLLSPGSTDFVSFDGPELARQDEISICQLLNPVLFGFFKGAIVSVRAGTVIPLRRVPIPMINLALFVMIFCRVSDVKVVVKVRLLLKIWFPIEKGWATLSADVLVFRGSGHRFNFFNSSRKIFESGVQLKLYWDLNQFLIQIDKLLLSCQILSIGPNSVIRTWSTGLLPMWSVNVTQKVDYVWRSDRFQVPDVPPHADSPNIHCDYWYFDSANVIWTCSYPGLLSRPWFVWSTWDSTIWEQNVGTFSIRPSIIQRFLSEEMPS